MEKGKRANIAKAKIQKETSNANLFDLRLTRCARHHIPFLVKAREISWWCQKLREKENTCFNNIQTFKPWLLRVHNSPPSMVQTGISREPSFTGFGISWFSWVWSISELMSLHRDLASAVETTKVSKLTALKIRESFNRLLLMCAAVKTCTNSSVIDLREFLSPCGHSYHRLTHSYHCSCASLQACANSFRTVSGLALAKLAWLWLCDVAALVFLEVAWNCKLGPILDPWENKLYTNKC